MTVDVALWKPNTPIARFIERLEADNLRLREIERLAWGLVNYINPRGGCECHICNLARTLKAKIEEGKS